MIPSDEHEIVAQEMMLGGGVENEDGAWPARVLYGVCCVVREERHEYC